MATYKVEWVENKTTSKGPIKKANLSNESGELVEEVTIWPNFPGFEGIGPGAQLNGDLVVKKNGEYTNKTLYASKTYNGVAKAALPRKVSPEREDERIRKAQDRKNESIAFFNATNCAIEILSKFDLANWTPSEVQEKIAFWRKWFLSEWQAYEVEDYKSKHQPF